VPSATPMQVRFTEADKLVIDRLKTAYGASSVAETLRRAIQVASTVLDAEQMAIVKVSKARKSKEQAK
jgi:hypothetical protein